MRNLLTDFDGTVLAMCEVESNPFAFLEQSFLEFNRYNALAAKKWLDGLDIWAIEDPYCNTTIYGLGGWNRWFVYGTGEVKFSRRHAESEASVRKAEELGFEIFG